MTSTITKPGIKKSRKIQSKQCVKCGKILPLTAFYSNSDWGAQSFHDAWCQECATKHCVDKETLREYCWYNNRSWSEETYEGAVKKAKYSLANDPDYLNPQTSKRKMKQIEGMAVARAFFSVMNLTNLYKFSRNIDDEGPIREFAPDS